ncbi:hypothetical protein [Dactylosporangium sp. NPDC000521]|uniref:hypothetical protein n=1 Tax=Dactylosporangium sp. NPDC000521 TaxID=3363975 RepID=UPI0036BABE2F
MTHQHHLDAQSALWSLRAAREALDVHVYAAQRERGMALVEAADGIGSQRFGTRRALGGRPGDPTANAAVNGTAAASASAVLSRRAEQLAASTTATLAWLARELRLAGASDPLDRLQAAAAALPVHHAARLALWIAEADQRIRQYLMLPVDEHLQAEQLAARLTTADRPITADRIWDWARRSRRRGDKLHGLLPAVHTPGQRTGNAWYRVRDAERVLTVTARAKASVGDQAA